MSSAAIWGGCAHTCALRWQVKQGKGELPFSAAELSYHRERNVPQEPKDGGTCGGTCGLFVLCYIHCFLRALPKGLKVLRDPQGTA